MARSLRIALALAMMAVMLLPSLAPLAAAATPTRPNPMPLSRPFISPVLLNPASSFWKYGALVDRNSTLTIQMSKFVETLESRGVHVVKPSTPVGRIMVLLPPKPSKELVYSVAKSLVFVSAVLPAGRYTIVLGLATPKTIEKLAETPGVLAVLPDARIDELIHTAKHWPPGVRADPDARQQSRAPVQPQETGAGLSIGYHYTVNITRAVDVWKTYRDMGNYTTIAIIDTGVDYASPALGEDAIARDSNGLPMILDLSGGLVFFPVAAEIVNSTTIYVNASKLYAYLPLFMFWNVGEEQFEYFNGQMVFYNASGYYTVPSQLIANALKTGKPIRFGVAYETVLTPAGLVVVSAPAIIGDSNGDGYYDVIYLDLSDAAYYLNKAMYLATNGTISIPGAPSAPDHSFADEKPITYGSEIAARDFNGDGYYDLSFGALAGYEYDSYGFVLAAEAGLLNDMFNNAQPGFYMLYPLTMWELWDYEGIGMTWPGIDPVNGLYAAFQYDFYSHGTFCATTAAGRPVPAYTGYGTGGIPVSLVVGQAPAAKIAAADMFFTGDAAVSVYFMSGFDLQTPYAGLVSVGKALVPVPMALKDIDVIGAGLEWKWVYTGRHQADITSNSWGISEWALWGFASGLDPISAVFDYTTLVSGTAHFIAMGNGGPGYGTATVPGAAALGIGVGAATEFTYRPMFGYLPGGNREVVSWSDRGPTAMGLAKPDVVAIGSFAFAVGRTWDSLTYGVLSGNPFYTTDLFGGTSQATPMTAGVAALVVTAYKMKHDMQRMPAPLLKTILMDAADDMGFDPYSQGAGFVDAYKAVKLVMEGGTLVYNPYFLNQYLQAAGTDMETFTYGGTVTKASWYEPKLYLRAMTGSVAWGVLELKGKGQYNVEALQMVKTLSTPLTRLPGTTVLLPTSGDTLLLPLGRLGDTATIPVAVIDPAVLEKYDLVRIYAYYPYKYFDNGGRYYNTTHSIMYNGLELWLWIDLNGDGVVQLNETARIQYDLRGANAFTVEVGKLLQQIAEIEKLVEKLYGVSVAGKTVKLLLVYRVWGNGWAGTNVVVPLHVLVEGFNLEKTWNLLVYPTRVYAYGRPMYLRVVARAPYQPGVYEYYVRITGGSDNADILVPVTVVAYRPVYAYTIRLNDLLYRFIDSKSPYRVLHLRGAFDYTWRYESGDWRVIPLYVNPYMARYLKALVVDVTWPNATDPSYTSNLDVMMFGPHTFYMANVFEGSNSTGYWEYPVQEMKVAGYLLGGELSADFTAYWDSPAPGHSRIVVPIDGPGVYYLVVRNIQFSGDTAEDVYKVTIAPVVVRSFPVFMLAGTTRYLPLYMYALAGHVFDGINVTYTGEALKANTVGQVYSYFDNATFINITVARSYGFSSSYFSSYNLVLKISVSKDAPVKSFERLMPLLIIQTKTPVLTVGYERNGLATPLYTYTGIPLFLDIIVYKLR